MACSSASYSSSACSSASENDGNRPLPAVQPELVGAALRQIEEFL
jgi:hypothetical protein